MVTQMKASVKALETKVDGIVTGTVKHNVASAVPTVQTVGVTWGVPSPGRPSGSTGVAKGDLTRYESGTMPLKRSWKGEW